MKKLSADGTASIGLKMSSNLREKLASLSKECGQPESAILRAALLYSIPLFKVKPEWIPQLDAGAKVGPLEPAILMRAVMIAEKYGVDVEVVLSAIVKSGTVGIERNPAVDRESLNALAMGILDIPNVQQMVDSFVVNSADAITESLGVRAGMPIASHSGPEDLPKPEKAKKKKAK